MSFGWTAATWAAISAVGTVAVSAVAADQQRKSQNAQLDAQRKAQADAAAADAAQLAQEGAGANEAIAANAKRRRVAAGKVASATDPLASPMSGASVLGGAAQGQMRATAPRTTLGGP